MGFISPNIMSAMQGQDSQFDAGPSQNWMQRLMGSMGGPQPVGGPTGMQRLGGALSSAIGAPMMAKQPDMGFGGGNMGAVPSAAAAGGMMRPAVMPQFSVGPMMDSPMGSSMGAPSGPAQGGGIFNKFRKMKPQQDKQPASY